MASPATSQRASSPAGRVSLRDVLFVLIAAAAALALHGPLLNWDLRMGDEGYLVHAVQRLAAGEVLYRDVLRHYMPGVYYMFVPWFEWLGPDLLWIRTVWLVWLAAICGGAYLLVRPLAPPWIAVLAGLLPAVTPPPSHKTFVPAMVLLGLACCRAASSPAPGFRRVVAIGVGLGIVFLYRQEVALFSLAVCGVTLCVTALRAGGWRQLRRQMSGLSVGLALSGLPVLGALAAAGALAPMLTQVVSVASEANVEVDLPYPALLADGVRWNALPYYFPAAMTLLGATTASVAALRRRFDRSHALLLQWSTVAALMHVLVVQRSDPSHLLQILLAPTLILVGCLGLCWRAAGAGSGRQRLAATTAAAALATSVLALGGWGLRVDILPRYEGKRTGVKLDEPRAPVVVHPWLAEEVRLLLAYIRERTRPGEPIFVAPYSPMYYYLSERPNPTRYDIVFPGSTASPEMQREIRDDLEAAGVRVVLIRDVAMDGLEERRFPRYTPHLADYFGIEFVPDRRIGDWLCLVRRPRSNRPPRATEAG